MRIVLFTLLILLGACSGSDSPVITTDNDTTKVIALVLRTALNQQQLPELQALAIHDPAVDSIWITSDTVPLTLIPTRIGLLHFKVVSSAQICSRLKAFAKKERTPNYLDLREFFKMDSGYYVHLANFSCYPFGAGGSMAVEIKRNKDSLVIYRQIYSSF